MARSKKNREWEDMGKEERNKSFGEIYTSYYTVILRKENEAVLGSLQLFHCNTALIKIK